MNVPQAFGILLLGAGSGGLLVWLQQAAVKRRFLQDIESQLREALFGGQRRRALRDMRRIGSSSLTCSYGPPETIPSGDDCASPTIHVA